MGRPKRTEWIGTDSRLSLTIHGREVIYRDVAPASRVAAFIERIEFSPNEDGCWSWMGGRTAQDYGFFNWEGRNIPSHRFAWIVLKGPIEGGHEIHHLCSNRCCVNPAHLQSVTQEAHDLLHARTNPVVSKRFRTHCHKGHPLSGDNLIIGIDPRTGRDHRHCRACKNEWSLSKWRKNNPAAPRIERTHCKNGHELTPENTYEYLGVKQCKACHLVTSAKYYETRLSPRAVPREPKPPKTHCRHGHEWIPENLYTYDTVARGVAKTVTVCNLCRAESGKKTYTKLKAKHGK